MSFVNTNSWDSWRFGTSKLGGRTLNFNELVKAIPDYYRYPYQYSVPYQIAQFRRDEGKTSVEVYYALSGDQVTHEVVGPGVRAVDVVQAMFLFDAAWDTLRREVGRVRMMPWIQYVSTNRGYLIASEQLTLAPGDYHLAGEAEDQANRKVGTFRDPLRVRRFSRDSLEISSLLMARRIVEREEWPMERARYMVLPNPLRGMFTERKRVVLFRGVQPGARFLRRHALQDWLPDAGDSGEAAAGGSAAEVDDGGVLYVPRRSGLATPVSAGGYGRYIAGVARVPGGR